MTVQLFGTNGQKFLHCPGTKVQEDKLKMLPRDRPGQPIKIRDRTWDRTVQDFDSLSHPVLQDKTGQSIKGRSKTGKYVLKQENEVLKQEILSFFLKILSINSFCPGTS
jgi:hypothetical protein